MTKYRIATTCRRLPRDCSPEARSARHKEKMHAKAQQRIRDHISLNDPARVAALLEGGVR